ncbi:MAG: UDP-N-acetylmuramoyl-L-alanyl-D-glutamate--2,6-diaminopimelate ligase [Deltaproteobacteria bacterium]|nr:UDP-N-acetylmuramoyl-L-alanyl-D-glutamate--2,6-diaminopimelate ligase [Deltaproteobacteria bacterium]
MTSLSLPSQLLSTLLARAEILDLENLSDLSEISVRELAAHSAEVKPGSIFFALPGSAGHGRTFIDDALVRGATVVVHDGDAPLGRTDGVPSIRVVNARAALRDASAAFYGTPSSASWNCAVTGTNGKSSVSWLIAQATALLGSRAAYVGTLGMFLFDHKLESVLSEENGQTTPSELQLQRFLVRSQRLGMSALACELTSHALAQERVTGIEWDCGVFTNLTRDHLDYHGTMEEYGDAKRRLFRTLLPMSSRRSRSAIINTDDPFGEVIREDSRTSGLEVLTTSTRGGRADVELVDAIASPLSTRLTLRVRGDTLSVHTQLIGDYNRENVLLAIGAMLAKGATLADIASIVPELQPVPGRLERVTGAGRSVFVDYAHTPDALVKAQQSLRSLSQGRLITVFGCGGDRDRGKRPLMGSAVAAHADLAVVTSDNPRSEDPMSIIHDVLPGLAPDTAFHVEPDRRAAIEYALRIAAEGDLILIAGKGHEPYQEVNGTRLPFSDREVCLELLNHLE